MSEENQQIPDKFRIIANQANSLLVNVVNNMK